ncbi:hypothetical protein E2C01_015930 [Portunus trituberculatus]|uniref:Uncharacterized protein n=1 Tax=Portunus trituberculatus TaxID=210409 RepID=A0A5B7DMR3_PORTR|nr:hypothetical protein [Portunus trituberculatus]
MVMVKQIGAAHCGDCGKIVIILVVMKPLIIRFSSCLSSRRESRYTEEEASRAVYTASVFKK